MTRTARIAAVCVLAVTAAAVPSATASAAPNILEAEYYEDLEDGYRYNVSATIRGEVDGVTAKSGSFRTGGHSGHIGEGGRDKTTWFFRERKFVKRVRADLYADGFAVVTITAINELMHGDHAVIEITKKRCELRLEPDPQFGDYATGDCDKV